MGFVTRRRWTEPFVVNPVDSSLAWDFVVGAAVSGVGEWETYGGEAILGEVGLDTEAHYDDGETDGVNAISLGPLPEEIIGVTTVWGVRWGPPKERYIAEADMLLNNLYSRGDATTDPALMDLLNILTHELGHCAGMDDLYDTAASEETMHRLLDRGRDQKARPLQRRHHGRQEALSVGSIATRHRLRRPPFRSTERPAAAGPYSLRASNFAE